MIEIWDGRGVINDAAERGEGIARKSFHQSGLWGEEMTTLVDKMLNNTSLVSTHGNCCQIWSDIVSKADVRTDFQMLSLTVAAVGKEFFGDGKLAFLALADVITELKMNEIGNNSAKQVRAHVESVLEQIRKYLGSESKNIERHVYQIRTILEDFCVTLDAISMNENVTELLIEGVQKLSRELVDEMWDHPIAWEVRSVVLKIHSARTSNLFLEMVPGLFLLSIFFLFILCLIGCGCGYFEQRPVQQNVNSITLDDHSSYEVDPAPPPPHRCEKVIFFCQKIIFYVIIAILLCALVVMFLNFYIKSLSHVEICPRARRLFHIELFDTPNIISFDLSPFRVEGPVYTHVEFGPFGTGKVGRFSDSHYILANILLHLQQSATLSMMAFALWPPLIEGRCMNSLFETRNINKKNFSMGYTRGTWGLLMPMSLIQNVDLSTRNPKINKEVMELDPGGWVLLLDTEGTLAINQMGLGAARMQNILTALLATHLTFVVDGPIKNFNNLNELSIELQLIEYARSYKKISNSCVNDTFEIENFGEALISIRNLHNDAYLNEIDPPLVLNEVNKIVKLNDPPNLYVPFELEKTAVITEEMADILHLVEKSQILVQPTRLEKEHRTLHYLKNDTKFHKSCLVDENPSEFGVAYSVYHHYVPFILKSLKEGHPHHSLEKRFIQTSAILSKFDTNWFKTYDIHCKILFSIFDISISVIKLTLHI